MTDTTNTLLLIDGSTLGGGGQLLRNSVALAALLGRPIKIDKLLPKGKQRGLKAQDAAGLHLVAEICSGNIVGCEPGSTRIEFHPGSVGLAGDYTADSQTAGSIALLLQAALPCLLYRLPGTSLEPTYLTFHGATNPMHGPQIDYIANVFLPFLRRHFSLSPVLRVAQRGFSSRGGGIVHISVSPRHGPFPAITLTKRGPVTAVSGCAYAAGLPGSFTTAMRKAAEKFLVKAGINQQIINIETIREKPSGAVGCGSGIVLWATTQGGCVIGSSARGSREKESAQVGQDAAKELIRNLEHGGCVDEYMQDQIIIFLALAQGRSVVATGPLTLHTKTAIWAAERLTGAKFEVKKVSGDKSHVQCDGIGYIAPGLASSSCADKGACATADDE